MQAGFFDWQERIEQLTENGDPLVKLSQNVKWNKFRKTIEKVRSKNRKQQTGRKPFDAVVMFKILILQSLYNLSDDQTEYQIRDRISFMRFLNLSLYDTVPDAKTIWLFREQLTNAGVIKKLFERFDDILRSSGFTAKKGQIVDASIVSAPKQRNTKEENAQIKQDTAPDVWTENKKRQKDTDARWMKKNGRSFFGYKNHISIDAEHKFVRNYAVTSASVHDSNVFEELLDNKNDGRFVWADSAYFSQQKLQYLKESGFVERLSRKGCRDKKLTKRQKKENHFRSRVRCRVEHIFGVQAQRAGNLLLRSIGLLRAKAKIGLRNLAYNISRYAQLTA